MTAIKESLKLAKEFLVKAKNLTADLEVFTEVELSTLSTLIEETEVCFGGGGGRGGIGCCMGTSGWEGVVLVVGTRGREGVECWWKVSGISKQLCSTAMA